MSAYGTAANLLPVVLNDWNLRRSSNLESLRAHAIRVVVDRPAGGRWRRTAGPRDERTGRWRARREADGGGERAGRQAFAKLSASEKQTGMRQRASMRVKQSKSQQIVANADADTSTPVIVSIHGQFEGTGCRLKPANSHQNMRQLTRICRQVMRNTQL
jgi:hypothetical protein